MDNKELQLESGNYTRIVNRVIDELVKAPLLGAELAICLFVIRKTYGYGKSEDKISLSQFEEGVKRSRPTVNKALKNLQLVNILKLVKVGNNKGACSIWRFNKYYKTWTCLVNTPELVKDRSQPSKEKLKKLVKTPTHTKDNIQKIIQKKTATAVKKKIVRKKPAPMNAERISAEETEQARFIRDIFEAFGKINPAMKKSYGNTTQRQACVNLIKEYSFERVLFVVGNTLPRTNKIQFFPTIDTPYELFNKWSKLESAIVKYKLEKDKPKGKTVSA